MPRKLLRIAATLILLLVTNSTFAQHHKSSFNSQLDQYIEQVSELSSRARANVYFANPQSLFRGVQVNFVNVGTGNLTFLRRDLVASGRIPLVLARVYDSSGKGSVDFGAGWTLSAAESIIVADGKAHLFSENGSTIDFVKVDDASFGLEKDYPSDYLGLQLVDASTLEAKLRTGFTKQFQLIGDAFRLAKVTDRNGNEVLLSYSNGLLAKIENANHSINILRNAKGRILSAQDDQNRRVQFAYDAQGRLIEVDDLGGNAWTYSYNADGRLKAAKDPLQRLNFGIFFDDNARVRRLQLPSGTIQFNYDEATRSTTILDRKALVSRFFQNEDGITTRVVNPLGEETAISLDDSRNVLSISRNGSVVERMEYDQQHRITARHSTLESGTVDRTYSHDPVTGQLAGIHASDGQDQSFTYDENGNLASAVLPAGEQKFRFSSNGDLAGLSSSMTNLAFSPDPDGLFASMTDGQNARTELLYKAGSQLREVTFPGGTKGTFEYQPSGLRSKLILSEGRRAEYNYDPAGNLTASKVFDKKGKQINGQTLGMDESYQLTRWTLFDGTVTDFKYDRNGNLTEIKKGKSITRFEYDAVNRLNAVITPTGQRLTYSYKPGERSLIEQHQHAAVLVEDLRDSGLTFAGQLQVTATRPVTDLIGSARFSETLGTFQLSGSDGTEVVRPQEILQAALKKLFLYDTYASARELRSGFDIPFNTMFMPAEYVTINCCPECFYDGGWDCPPCFTPPPPQPSLNFLDPASANINAGSVLVTMEGAFNDSSETVTISGTGLTPSNPAPVDANGKASSIFTIASTATVGDYSVFVTDSGGTSNGVTFSLVPVITGISPAQGLVGAKTHVSISGKGFGTAATVNAGSNITVANIVVVSDTQVTADFTPANATTAGGNQSVTVTSNSKTSASRNFFVQIPTTVTAVSVTTLPTGTDPSANGCTPTQNFGIKVAATYQVFDQTGTGSINSSLMEPQETITNQCINGSCSNPVPVFSDVGPSRITGTSQFTNPSGQFTDAPLGICGGIAFNATVTQDFQMLVGGAAGYHVRTNNFTISGPAAGQGSISNGSDVGKSRP